MGEVGAYAEIFVIISELLGGLIMDTFGRKYPLLAGQFISAIFMALVPLFHEVYPGFFICRVMIGLGTCIAVNIPLLPDYVKKESVGLANGYTMVVMQISSIFSGTVIYQIAANITDQKWIYFSMSIIIFLFSVFMIFGIKDVNLEAKNLDFEKSEKITVGKKLKIIGKTIFSEFKSDPGFFICVLNNLCNS